MSFDIDAVTGDMLDAAKNTIGKEWMKVKEVAAGFFKSKKKRLVMLAELRIKKEITEKELNDFLADEKFLLETELLALKVIGKAIAEKAANAALDVLYDAIKKITGVKITNTK